MGSDAKGVVGLTLILSFIASHMGFLWESARFRISGSMVSVVNGGSAFVIVESSVVRLRFVCDREQLFLDLQPIADGEGGAWYSIDLVRRLFLLNRERSAVLDAGYAEFLKNYLLAIEQKFGPDWPEVEVELKKLRLKRSREMFG